MTPPSPNGKVSSKIEHEANELVETYSDWFVTTTTIKQNVSLERLMTILRVRKTTGTICFHMKDGGVRRIELTEKTRAVEK